MACEPRILRKDPVLLCKDCAHSRISAFGKYGSYIFDWSEPKAHWYRCAKSIETVVINPVTGPDKKEEKMEYCEIARKYSECGPNGKFWTPKHKKDLFKMLTKEYND